MIPVRTSRLLPDAAWMLVSAALPVLALLSGSLLPVRNAQAQIHARGEPAAGMFLVASRELRGSGFAESVILIVQHDADGTMGLIVNQPTDTNPAALLSDTTGLEQVGDKLFIGGPVAAWGVIMLLHSDRTPANAEHIFGNVYTSGDRKLLSQLIASGAFENRNGTEGRSGGRPVVRLYAGHAGWVPGQLDAEIRRGSWLLVPATENFIFSTEPRTIWRQLIEIGDRLIVRNTRTTSAIRK